MKKIKNLLLLTLCIFITSCNDDDPIIPKLEVLASNITFTAAGGTGSVQLSHGYGIKAISDQEWCSVTVEQSVVKVSVTANDNLEGRTAGITITTENDKMIVPVSQEGCILSYKLCELGHNIPYEGGSATVHFRCNKPYEVNIPEKDKAWLSYKADLDNGTLTFIALPSEDKKPRASIVKVIAAGKEISYHIGSYAEKDLTGMWGAAYEKAGELEGPIIWQFTKEGNGIYTDDGVLSEEMIPVPMEFKNGYLHITNGTKVANATDDSNGEIFSIWTTVLKHGGGISWDPKIQYVAYPSLFQGKFALVFGNRTDLGYDYIDGFAFWVFKSDTPSVQSNAGYLELFNNLILFKIR